MSDNITLVIFTCEGRENLLLQTLSSFKKACIFNFKQCILVIDGPFNEQTKAQVDVDLIIQSPKRKGYVNSIGLALLQIKTPYFFWLEDDWDFPNKLEIKEWLTTLENDAKALQLVLAKDSLDKQNQIPYKEMHVSDLGFSANPSINKTPYIQVAFSKLIAAQKTDATRLIGFENYIEHYRKSEGLHSLILFKNEKAFVSHSGYLESTAREYHMINSIDEKTSAIDKEYISGFGYGQNISLKNKLGLIPKLFLAFIWLSFHAFNKRYVYDYGLRIYRSYLKRFKS